MSDKNQNIVVCAATAGLEFPIPGATREHCMICAEEVWVAPSTRELVADPQFICNECAPGFRETHDGEVMGITREQRAELYALGFTDAEIDRAVLEFLANQQKERKRHA